MGNQCVSARKGPAYAGGFEGLARRHGHTPKSMSVDLNHKTTEHVTTLIVPPRILSPERQHLQVVIFQIDESLVTCSEAYRATPAGLRITFSKARQRICVLQKEMDGFLLLSYERPRPFDNVDGAAMRAAAESAHNNSEGMRKSSASPAISTDDRGAKLYAYAKITRDLSHKLSRHSFQYRLFDDELERPHWVGEITWPGRDLSEKLGIPIGFAAPCFQFNVRSALEWGGGPVLAAVDALDEGTLAASALPPASQKALALSAAPGMDALGLLCFAVAAEELLQAK